MRHITRTKAVIIASLALMLLFSSIFRTQGRFQQPTSRIIFEGERPVILVEWSPVANLIAVISWDKDKKHKPTILDTTAGEEVKFLNYTRDLSYPAVVAWSPDGKTLATLEFFGYLRLWDLETGENISQFDIYTKIEQGASVLEAASLAWSPDGTRIAMTDGGVRLGVWDIVGGEFLIVPLVLDQQEGVVGVAWSPDGTTIAVVSSYNNIEIIDANTFQQISMLSKLWGYVPPTSKHYAQIVEWSPDGERIVHYNNQHIIIRDVFTGEATTLDNHKDFVQAIAWSPDGKTLASGSGSWRSNAQGDNTVRIWDMETYEELYVLEGHTDYVTTVAWSPDSSQVASGSADGTIRIWDIESPQDTSE